METPSSWPQIRAGLLAAVIAVNALSAIPTPGRLSKQQFEQPGPQEELVAWVELLHSVGLPIEKDWLEQTLIDVTDRWIAVRSQLIGRPTGFTRRWLGVRQNWALFARPDTFPNVLTVDVRREGAPYEEVYRSLHPEHTALGAQLRYRRIRGLYDVPGRPGAPYHNLCKWIAAQLFAADPTIADVRIRKLQTHISRPGEPSDPSQKVLQNRVIRRGHP